MIVRALLRKLFVHWVPFCPPYDRVYALVRFLLTHKRWPKRYLFNDRLVRLKLDGELLDPARQALTDKEYSKRYVETLVGSEYVPKTYAVLRNMQEVFDYEFPRECVVKPSHASGKVMFIRDGIVDKKRVASWLKIDYYRWFREQNYAHLKPKIIVEEFALGSETIPDDFKVFCVDGMPKVIMVCYDRATAMTRRLYDTHWNSQPYTLLVPLGRQCPCPKNLDEMLRLAATLATGFDFIRVDFYTDDVSLRVGEITNCHGGAHDKFSPPEGELQLSALLFGEDSI